MKTFFLLLTLIDPETGLDGQWAVDTGMTESDCIAALADLPPVNGFAPETIKLMGGVFTCEPDSYDATKESM